MRFCTNCGARLSDEDAFCTSCGTSADAGTAPVSGLSTAEEVPASQPGATQRIADQPVGGQRAVYDAHRGSARPAGGQQAYGSAPYVPAGGMQPAYAGGAPSGNGKTRAIIIAAVAVIVVALVALAVMLLPGIVGGGKGEDPAGGTDTTTFTVSYDTNGGSALDDKSIREGRKLQRPEEPTRDNYRFDGWYTDSDLTEEAEFPLEVTEDLTLYAKWSDVSSGSSSDASSSSAASSKSSASSSKSSKSSTSAAKSKTETVTITVKGSDGTTRTEKITRDRATQRVLPDGNSRTYSASEIAKLSDAERCIAWNEIIAYSNGYAFKNSGLASYFGKCSWYSRNANADPGGDLSSAARANVDELQAQTSSWWKSLATS